MLAARDVSLPTSFVTMTDVYEIASYRRVRPRYYAVSLYVVRPYGVALTQRMGWLGHQCYVELQLQKNIKLQITIHKGCSMVMNTPKSRMTNRSQVRRRELVPSLNHYFLRYGLDNCLAHANVVSRRRMSAIDPKRTLEGGGTDSLSIRNGDGRPLVSTS